MKKLFFLIALVFSVVCFASPPPLEENVVNVCQAPAFDQDVDFVQLSVVEPVQGVPIVIIGNALPLQEGLQHSETKIPEVMVQKYFGENSFYKPPSINTAKCGFEINYQNSNYGYPLTADNC